MLSKFYNKNELADVRPEQLAHLADLEIVEGTSLSEVYRLPIGGQSVVTTDRKEAIKIYIREHGEVKTADLVKAFALSDGYMRALLREMVNAGTLEKLEDKRYTRYKLSDEG